MEAHWDNERGYCVPNPQTYAHLWLWDSCFDAIIWSALGDERALRELDAVLAGQLQSGLVPHMRYGAQASDTYLGPLSQTSSLAQPPMFGHAARVLSEAGMRPSPETLERARRGLNWFWEHRRTEVGLIYVVHPWEAGNDHGQRWDDFGAPGRVPEGYSRPARTAWNKDRVHDISFSADGAAEWSTTFVTCPAAFNAYVAFNMSELAMLLDDAELAARAETIASLMDELLWDEDEAMWMDLAIVGGGPSVRAPISDGLMGALVTRDRTRALAALAQIDDPDRFAAPFGPSNVARLDPSYDPNTYWRGPAWPPLNYLLWLAQKRWGLDDRADANYRRTLDGALTSGWAEYWNPETGAGLGAVPQSWTGIVVAMRPHGAPSTA
jgi:hypothetical protein